MKIMTKYILYPKHSKMRVCFGYKFLYQLIKAKKPTSTNAVGFYYALLIKL
ncbi:hypothetical protein PTRA_a3001 [Pseudoalteromonas translucida KMM 520]|uniref:Uncharacterized protein n=1 Tax=Pseudoalteromonas translucida KMM 520 TaxID=1315283 RepID=A0A0U2IT18_9GAMM|nr:hypothetical protein PTRA_a3001 [Pseudoalteromonas translucida KMM 520]